MHYLRKHGKSELGKVLAIVRKILIMLMLIKYIKSKLKHVNSLKSQVQKKVGQNDKLPFHDFRHSL